jgi:pimeloyl-ACP methyl ester carboxylesterase
MYAPGKDANMLKGDWVGLANRLTDAGYNVFRFDWRGHGKSTDIKNPEKFWGNPAVGLQNDPNPITGPWNTRYITGANKKPVKADFYYKDLGEKANAYMPVYLLDLAAVRAHLDSKNDTGDVNTSSIYLIGSEAAATLGFGWLATEWNRPAFYPTPNQLGIAGRYMFVPQPLNDRGYDTGGADISGAIWLSPARPASISLPTVRGFVSGILPNGSRMPMSPTNMRENNPMLFLYGAEDKKGEKEAATFFNEILVANGDVKNGVKKLEDTFLRPVAKGAKLSGVNLLGNVDELGTETTIMNFMSRIQKDRKQITRKARGYTGPYFIRLDAFGLFPTNN